MQKVVWPGKLLGPWHCQPGMDMHERGGSWTIGPLAPPQHGIPFASGPGLWMWAAFSKQNGFQTQGFITGINSMLNAILNTVAASFKDVTSLNTTQFIFLAFLLAKLLSVAPWLWPWLNLQTLEIESFDQKVQALMDLFPQYDILQRSPLHCTAVRSQ